VVPSFERSMRSSLDRSSHRRFRMVVTLGMVLGVLGVWAASAHALAVVPAPGCTTTSLPRNDDSLSAAVPLGFSVFFGGTTYSAIYIDNNGFVRFRNDAIPWWQLRQWESTSIPVIAPFHADVDTRGALSAEVTYGPITYEGRAALCINWVDVGYFSARDDKRNSFQLILVDRSDVRSGEFDIIMNYDRVQWEAGDDSGAVGGVGGAFPPRAGFYDGVNPPVELPGSLRISELLDGGLNALVASSRIDNTNGRYIFSIRNFTAQVRLRGTVRDRLSNVLAGAFVEACLQSVSVPICVGGRTDSTGHYEIVLQSFGLPWRIEVFPPAGLDLTPFNDIRNVNVNTTIDVTLQSPAGVPLGTTLAPARESGLGIPVVHWRDPLQLATQGCLGAASARYTARQGSVILATGDLVESPAGRYQATVGPFEPAHGFVQVTVELTGCPDGSSGSFTFDAYIDPSGFVLTTRGDPVVGARVTLYRGGSPLGPFEVVPDGSAIMSPSNRTNPDYTDASGHFGWDVVAGYYVVRAEKEGCVDPGDPLRSYIETDILPVPPEWTDLELILDCEAVTPPELTVPEPISADATGAAGAVVEYEVTAFDGRDGFVPVACWPQSGELFPLGLTEVQCGAGDSSGNVAYASFEVFVSYAWSGFLRPFDPDDDNRFKRGRTVPIKFMLTGASAGITDALAKLYLARVIDGVPGPELPAEPPGHGHDGPRFRYDCDSGHYIFNWSTKRLEKGTYRLRIELGDGVLRTAEVELR
jgi:hypothetical protein